MTARLPQKNPTYRPPEETEDERNRKVFRQKIQGSALAIFLIAAIYFFFGPQLQAWAINLIVENKQAAQARYTETNQILNEIWATMPVAEGPKINGWEKVPYQCDHRNWYGSSQKIKMSKDNILVGTGDTEQPTVPTTVITMGNANRQTKIVLYLTYDYLALQKQDSQTVAIYGHFEDASVVFYLDTGDTLLVYFGKYTSGIKNSNLYFISDHIPENCHTAN